MKILFATHFFPPGHAGGTESYTLGLARTLQRMGHEPSIICAEDWGEGSDWQPRHRETTFANLPVRRLSWNWQLAPDPFVYLYDNPATERHLASYLADLSPDVMHVTSCYSLSASIIRAAHRHGVPIILTLTDFWFISPRQTLSRPDRSLCAGPDSALTCARCLVGDSRLYRLLSHVVPGTVAGSALAALPRWPRIARSRGIRGYVGDVATRATRLRAIFDQVDQAIAPSHALKDIFVKNGYPAERLLVSAYGLDAGWAAHVRDREPKSPLCVGYVGQIEPTKGVDILVQAFRSVPRRDWRLVIHGGLEKNPSFTERVRALAAGDARIQFRGQFDREHLADVLSDLDVVVVPSTWFENAPVVISEAFAARKPVIATDLPGMTELVEHEVNGLVFGRGDVAGLASALERVAADPDLRRRLTRGIQPVKTIEDEAQGLIRLYASLAPQRAEVAV
jgi:glycosyltransferase involved in cell wall biosynthesis